jgi:hypothetical protein
MFIQKILKADQWVQGVKTLVKFPFSIECKNQEALNVWKSYEQAEANSGDYEPVVFIKRNNQKPLVVVDAEYFIRIHNERVD